MTERKRWSEVVCVYKKKNTAVAQIESFYSTSAQAPWDPPFLLPLSELFTAKQAA